MEKEIINQISNQLAQFKNYQLLILIIAFLLFTIVTILQTVYTSKLIEKYKNQLKKAELKFSIFNEIQITKLSEFFAASADLKGALASIFGTLEHDKHDISLDNWEDAYSLFDEFYSNNKYIIPKNIKGLIDKNKQLLINYNTNIRLLKEKHLLVNNLLEDISDEERQESLNLIDKETFEFNYKRATLELMLMAESIKVQIEEYFEHID